MQKNLGNSKADPQQLEILHDLQTQYATLSREAEARSRPLTNWMREKTEIKPKQDKSVET